MAAQKGKEILIKAVIGGVPTTIGGMRSKSISLNKETVDVTDSDSVNQWRELLSGAGVKSAAISGSGVFKDSAAEAQALAWFLNDTMPTLQFIVPDLGTFAATWDIPTLEYSGEYNAEVQYSMSFESASALTFTPA